MNPTFTKNLPGVFTLNERVAYLGEWKHGFMSMTAVGATSVGSVAVPQVDPTLSTNEPCPTPCCSLERTKFLRPAPGMHCVDVGLGKVATTAGAPFGHFKMGSTIVLVFEAPRHGVVWRVKAGERIKVGEALMTK